MNPGEVYVYQHLGYTMWMQTCIREKNPFGGHEYTYAPLKLQYDDVFMVIEVCGNCTKILSRHGVNMISKYNVSSNWFTRIA